SNEDKKSSAKLARELIALGFSVCATKGTQRALAQSGIEVQQVLKISEGRPNICDMLTNNEIALVINTIDAKANQDDTRMIRAHVLKNSVPYFTTLAASFAALHALKDNKSGDVFCVKALQDYLEI
ncbi:MAG: carbamoyl phosphate synthase large subunit, partial [Helicobacter sp.]|nr:carbamoyl phosphate synthase large subunit [Helicobacter sp.]